MRDTKRIVVAIVLVLGVLTASWTVFADATAIWPMYHRDMYHSGQNPDSTDIKGQPNGPSSLNLIWVFPRLEYGAGVSDSTLTTVDNADSGFSSAGDWLSDTTIGYGGACLFTGVITDPAMSDIPTATWAFPAGLPMGKYLIYVWIPEHLDKNGDPDATPTAEYWVMDSTGTHRVVYDQTVRTGSWQMLSSGGFYFTGGPGQGVRLSALETEPGADDTKTVYADAVRFFRVGEIYASPASAEVDITLPDPDDPTQPNVWKNPATCSFVGTIEPVRYNSDSHDPYRFSEGALYCVCGVTPTLLDPETDPGMPVSDKIRFEKIRKYLGAPIWRYPRNGSNPTKPDYVGNRDPIEGPISGGFFSSPTLARVALQSGGNPELVCFASAMDRQVYAIKADTGELLWKGPGLTVPEDDAVGIATTGREDAFGGSFHYVACVDPKDNPTYTTCTWTFGTTEQTNAAPTGAQGLSYAVYVWIPQAGGTGVLERSKTATYVVTYQDSSGNPTGTATVTVDQSNTSNFGTWIKLGGSYFNPSQVVLKNSATPEPPDPTDPTAPTKAASDYAVVADAIMFVPDSIDGLGYSSPVTDAEGPAATTLASVVFAMSVNGRAMSFNVNPADRHVGHLNWVYPRIRTARNPDPTTADQPSWGSIGASMAYSADRLYAATVDGTVRCIERAWSMPPAQKWVFPGPADTDEDPGGFTSSPTLDPPSRLYIGATDGIFYCLNMEDGTLRWRYPGLDPGAGPDDPPTEDPPLGAFRYSTPAVATVQEGGTPGSGIRRVWCGSSDGRIYSFEADTGARLYVDEFGKQHGAAAYYEPSLLAPIQGSVALDGATPAGLNPVMYVGDMNGTLHWRDAVNGSTQDWVYKGWNTGGVLFSSPNITNTKVSTTPVSWIYIGCSDGHLFAFTRAGGGWGGAWQGGDWPFPDSEPNSNANKTTAAPEANIQFEMFREDFHRRCNDGDPKHDPEPKDSSGNPDTARIDAWSDDFIVGKDMKVLPSSVTDVEGELTKRAKYRRQARFMPTARDQNNQIYFEWGESLYMILWNLPETKYLYGSGMSGKTSNITIRMTNASAGSSAGTHLSFKGTVSTIKDYTVVESDGKGGYTAFTDGGEDVRRSYALARLEIDGTRTSDPLPPPPGPGWIVTVEVKKQDSAGGSVTSVSWPLAELTGPAGSPSHFEPRMAAAKKDTAAQFKEASVGINNPIAIRDDGMKGGAAQIPLALGWGNGLHPSPTMADVHLNGNAIWTSHASAAGGFNIARGPTPVMDLWLVPHGTSSREAMLGVADRSATGMRNAPPPAQQSVRLSRFRIASSDMRFRGWPYSVEAQAVDALGHGIVGTSGQPVKYGFKFPWDFGQGSVDYPDIYRKYQAYQQVSSNSDASGTACTLWGVTKDTPTTAYPDSWLTPDTVLVSVDVPRFQPANVSDEVDPRNPNSRVVGYSRTMTAYIDSNGDGSCDTGNYVMGAPSTWQEAYRNFRAQVKVPPDPKIEVDEQLIDIGRAPHGLGEVLPSPFQFCAYNPEPLVQQWFKPVTIKSASNVNLYNIRINQALGLYGDQASPSQVLPGAVITSSLDPVIPQPDFEAFANDPFVSVGPNAHGLTTYLGYTLSKPRVGDPDPTIMTIPDRRKWDVDYTARQNAYLTIANTGWDAGPLPVMVSARVPLTQPIGTYQSWDAANQIPYIAVFSDLVGTGVPAVGDPVAMPSFQLKLAVRENQLTGGATPTTLPQVDVPPALPDMLPKVGDATPAAFRSAKSGEVNLFWSSNRGDSSVYGDTSILASAPWFLSYAVLGYSNKNWVNVDQYHWWMTPNIRIPDNVWDMSTIPPGMSLLPWSGSGPDALYSVRHYSPCIGENLAIDRRDAGNRTWLAWAGTADLKDNVTGKLTQSHLISYLDVTSGPTGDSYMINHDQTQVKRYPCPVPDGDRSMWMFWQGGSGGNWSIYYTWSSAGKDFPPDSWSPDMKLRTPDCMSSVGSPNALLRRWWADIRSENNENDFVDPYRDSLADPDVTKRAFDIVYSGTNKITRNSDIILSRYIASPPTGNRMVQPSRVAQPLPRVLNETLARDAKFGFYTSKHLGWVRAARGRPVGLDHWGLYASDNYPGTSITDPNCISPDYPYVRVVFPEGYADTVSGITLDPHTEISATDGSVIVRDPATGSVTEVEDPVIQRKECDEHPDPANRIPRIIPEIDDATGIYTYSYTRCRDYSGPSIADKVLGKMLIDFSSGIARFTKPLKEDRLPSGKFRAPEVHADYTPQAWRITTDPAADGSPRAFIEHTSMTDPDRTDRTMTDPNRSVVTPGLDPSWPAGQPAPVDRLWVFWRKTGTAIESSTIFYTTMRIGVDLTKLGLPPIPMNPIKGTFATGANISIQDALGPWEVDRTGTKVYFSEVDERYRSLITPDNAALVPMPANPITITYTPASGTQVTRELRDISWITELPEQSLFGFAAESNVNEGSIYAFADPQPRESGTSTRILSSKIWVFWTSTRGGNSDLFWETLSPNFWAR